MVKLGISGGTSETDVELLEWVRSAVGQAVVRDDGAVLGLAGARG